jgi:hypothetical protein
VAVADEQIEAALRTGSFRRSTQMGPVWLDALTAYVFYVEATIFKYRKTTDGGASWAAGVTLDSVPTNGVVFFAVWFDQWTPGDSGSTIHCCWVDYTADEVQYRTIDTAASDSLSATEVVYADGDGITETGWNARPLLSITKARGGNLYICYMEGGSEAFYRSTDGGDTWTSRTVPSEGADPDRALLVPADTSDSQDIAVIYYDASAGALSIKVYDDSANTWTETSIDASVGVNRNTGAFGIAATVRHADRHILAAYWNGADSATADLRTVDITATSTSPTITQKGNVLDDTGESSECCIFVDNNTDDVYVGYLKGGTWQATQGVFFKKSGDGMATWGSETVVDEDADDDHRWVGSGCGVAAGEAGRFYLVWVNDDLADLMGGEVNAVDITASGGGVTVDLGVAAAVATVADPSVVLGSVSVDLGIALAVAVVVDPGVQTGGDVTVDLGIASAVAVVVDPGVVLGSVSIDLGAAPAVAVVVDPGVVLGSVAVDLGIALAVFVVVDPSVIDGSVTPSPGLLTLSDAALGGAVLGTAAVGAVVAQDAGVGAIVVRDTALV